MPTAARGCGFAGCNSLMSLFPSHGGACQELSHVPIEPWWETNPATTPRQELGMVSPELQAGQSLEGEAGPLSRAGRVGAGEWINAHTSGRSEIPHAGSALPAPIACGGFSGSAPLPAPRPAGIDPALALFPPGPGSPPRSRV